MPCKILRIGIFFDGTDNNKARDSKKGAQSNIAKLSTLYRTGSFKDRLGRETVGFMLYVDGVGSYDTPSESNRHFIQRKYEKGTGAGAAKRIDKMIKDVLSILDDNPHGSSDPKQFSKRELDIFGFSRGAAEARDFVNTFYKKKVVTEEGDYSDVRFNFIGIYDTVASFGEPGNNVNVRPRSEYTDRLSELYLPKGMKLFGDENYGAKDIDMDANTTMRFPGGNEAMTQAKVEALRRQGWSDISTSYAGGHRGHNTYTIKATKPNKELYRPYNFHLSHAQAHRIVHIIANDELRKNFPLHDTYGAGAVVYNIIGVHSDAGASYLPSEEEKFTLGRYYETEALAEDAARSEADRRNATMGSRAGGRTQYRAEPKGEGVFVQFPTPHTSYYPQLVKNTPNDLSVVSLHLMYEEASRAYVPIKKPTDEIPEDLKEYYEYAKIAKENAYTYKENMDGKQIKNALAHHSGRDPKHSYDDKTTHVPLSDSLFNDEPGSGNDLHYDTNGNATRVIYHNDPDQAVLPQEQKKSSERD